MILAQPYSCGRIARWLVLATILGIGGTASGQEIATLTDTSGTVIKLQTFEVHLNDNTDFHFLALIEQSEFRGSSLYDRVRAVPIRQTNGAVLFISPDSIQEFRSDGRNATVILVNGDRLLGSPLSGASIGGESALGEVSVALPKVKNLKGNPENARRYLAAEDENNYRRWPASRERGWPVEYKTSAKITLVSGDHLSVGGFALIYEYEFSACDSTYSPCRPWSRLEWKVSQQLPIRFGESNAELEFSKTRSVALTAPARPGAAPISLSITLRSGDQITATIRSSNAGSEKKPIASLGTILYGEKKPIAFLGTTSYGFAQVPIERVKSIEFTE